MYLHFLSFLDKYCSQVVESILHGRQELVYSIYSIPWLLVPWQHKEQGHQWSCYWLSLHEIFSLTAPKGSSMMTSSNGNIFHVTGTLLNITCHRWIPCTQRPVTRSFDVLFDLRLNKRWNKQSLVWGFEMPSGSLWRQCNGMPCTWKTLDEITNILALFLSNWVNFIHRLRINRKTIYSVLLIYCSHCALHNLWKTSHSSSIRARYGMSVICGCISDWRFIIVRRAGLIWSQQDFEWWWSVPLSSASLY